MTAPEKALRASGLVYRSLMLTAIQRSHRSSAFRALHSPHRSLRLNLLSMSTSTSSLSQAVRTNLKRTLPDETVPETKRPKCAERPAGEDWFKGLVCT